MLKGHNLIFVGLPPSLLLHIHQEDVMLIIISLLTREEEEEKGDLIQGNLEVQSLVESSIATLDQSSILLLPSTCAPVSDPEKMTQRQGERERERERDQSAQSMQFFSFFSLHSELWIRSCRGLVLHQISTLSSHKKTGTQFN
jgi:hypothetical protein